MNLTIALIDGDRATLRTEDGHELIVPTSELPTGVTVGTVLTVHFDPIGSDARTRAAKDVLNEILGSE